VCEHGAFRSRIAAAFFNAAAPTGWRALSAGRDPQAGASPTLGPLLAGTVAAGHVETGPPRRLEVVHADRVIAVDCTVDGAEGWVTNAQSDQAVRDEIAACISRLVLELTAEQRNWNFRW
jgi:hypothetical protein